MRFRPFSRLNVGEMTFKNISENDQDSLDFQGYQPKDELNTRIENNRNIGDAKPSSRSESKRLFSIDFLLTSYSATIQTNGTSNLYQPQISKPENTHVIHQADGVTFLLITVGNKVEENVLDEECDDFQMHPDGKSYYKQKAGTNALSASCTWFYGQDARNHSNINHSSLLPTVAQIPVNHILSWQKT